MFTKSLTLPENFDDLELTMNAEQMEVALRRGPSPREIELISRALRQWGGNEMIIQGGVISASSIIAAKINPLKLDITSETLRNR